MFSSYHHQTVDLADNTLNHILNIIEEGTWDWDANSGHVTRSPGWYRMLGYETGVFDENVFTWENVIHPDDYPRVMEHFEQYIKGLVPRYRIEYRCRKADGHYLWIIDQGKIVSRNDDGSVARMIGAHHNIQQQKMAQQELIKQNKMLLDGKLSLEKMVKQQTRELESKNRELEEKLNEIDYISKTDSLTCVANRNQFEEILNKEISRANRYKHPLSLTLFDIDHFKEINDQHGHNTGDLVLKKVAGLIKQNIRQMDFLARWGGDEFVLIYPDLALDNACFATEKLRDLINQTEAITGVTISCSFGVSQYQSGDQLNDLFQRIDQALYQAKHAGRNRVECMI